MPLLLKVQVTVAPRPNSHEPKVEVPYVCLPCYAGRFGPVPISLSNFATNYLDSTLLTRYGFILPTLCGNCWEGARRRKRQVSGT